MHLENKNRLVIISCVVFLLANYCKDIHIMDYSKT